MQNLKVKAQSYFKTWWQIMLRPIYFYTKLKPENWQEEPLDFMLITAWLMAFLSTIAVFCLQYIPIGSTLLEKVAPGKIIIIVPTMLVLAFVFFVITILILGGAFTAALFCLAYFSSYVLHYVYSRLGGKGRIERFIQCMLYSLAPVIIFTIIILLTVIIKYGNIDFTVFKAGYNFFYLLFVIYSYGLWAIAARKTYGLSKAKAFQGAMVLFLCLLILGIIFDKIALSKLQSWID
jgi:hypothetical protein